MIFLQNLSHFFQQADAVGRNSLLPPGEAKMFFSGGLEIQPVFADFR